MDLPTGHYSRRDGNHLAAVPVPQARPPAGFGNAPLRHSAWILDFWSTKIAITSHADQMFCLFFSPTFKDVRNQQFISFNP